MVKRRTIKELQSFETFEKALREEISVSAEFDLPLTVLDLNVEGGWKEEDVRRALETLRVADLVAQPEPEEILVALPNTVDTSARVVEERLRKIVPVSSSRTASYRRGESVEDLLKRARSAGEQSGTQSA